MRFFRVEKGFAASLQRGDVSSCQLRAVVEGLP